MSRILVIDDTPWVRDLIAEVLEGAGFTVFTSPNGRQGLLDFQRHRPDLVITDIVMTEGDGLSVIRELRQQEPNLPILAISGGSPDFDMKFLLKVAQMEKVNGVLQKPFDNSELINLVKNF